MALISRSARLHLVQWLGSAVVLVGATGGVVAPGLAQTPPDSAPPESAPTSAPRPTLATGGFSVEQGDRLMAEAEAAIAAQNIPLAIERLQSARQLYNQVSGFYQELFNMFVGVDTRQVNSNRALALAAAQKRDEATFQLSLILRQQNRPEEAVPLLIEVLRSQQPGRDLGQRAYRQLFDMGFVQVPHVLPGTTAPAAPADDISTVLLRLNRADRPYLISRDDTRIRVDVPSANYVLSISFLYAEKLARFVTINAATGFSPEVDTAQADVRRVLETLGWQVRD